MARMEWRDTWKSQVPADVRVIPQHDHESWPYMDLFGIYRTRTFLRRRIEEVPDAGKWKIDVQAPWTWDLCRSHRCMRIYTRQQSKQRVIDPLRDSFQVPT